MSENGQVTGTVQLVSLHQVMKETVEYANRGTAFSPIVAEFMRCLSESRSDAQKTVLQVFNSHKAERIHKLLSAVDKLEDSTLEKVENLGFTAQLDMLKYLTARADKEYEDFKEAVSDDPKRNIYGEGGPPNFVFNMDSKTIQIGGGGQLDDMSAEDRGSIRSLFQGLKEIATRVRQEDGQPDNPPVRARAPGIPGSSTLGRPE